MEVKTTAFLLLCAVGLSQPALADTYTNSNGQRVECHYEQVQADKGHPVAAPLAGAVIGGLAGHQFGKGRGKDVATVAGAAGGAYAGNKIDQNTTDPATTRQVCQPVN